MADDYYKILGVEKNASQADIQKAYRSLARKYHPDMNPDDKTAKEKFQKVQSAYDVLNDTNKRELYDRYGSAFESAGAGQGPGGAPFGGAGSGYWRTEGGPGGAGGQGGFEQIDFSQLFGGGGGGTPFSELFGGFRRGAQGGKGKRGKAAAQPGADVHSEVEVPFQMAIDGGKMEVGVQRPDGKTDRIEVKIPAGIRDGAKIRLRGQGGSGEKGGATGDLLITIHVAPHPWFQRRGNDLFVRVPISLAEAVGGAKVDVPTPRGVISLRIPPNTSSGARLRVRGHGVKLKDGVTGDLYAEPQIVLPATIDEATAAAIRKLEEEHPSNPRAELHW
ncbi:MAG TPA: DnaJ C-terminal domain-containing protein [Pirellulales bacterium]|jgi:DnaJ-class molecular chaperone